MRPIVIVGLVVLGIEVVFVWRYFAAVHAGQNLRERQLNHREAYLIAWSEELGLEVDNRKSREQRAADLLDRALGPARRSDARVPS